MDCEMDRGCSLTVKVLDKSVLMFQCNSEQSDHDAKKDYGVPEFAECIEEG
jgi:hypothetical protein